MTRYWIVVAFLLIASCARREARPPIILISIDTLRADHLPAFGYRDGKTPAIDELVRDGVVYRNAWSHCPLTLPSHLSIFTGLLPPEHGVRDNAGYRFDAKAHATVAQLLRERGYRTAAAVSAFVLRAATGASAGFEAYDDAIGMIDGAPLGALQRPGMTSERIAEQWLDAHRDEPFFYFLHLYEPHAPYEPTYDADVMKADHAVGALLAYLRRAKLYDRALIVLVSDHGEGLMDHGEQEHGVFLYRESLHVPVIVKLPHGERRGTASDALVQLADVAPTLLDVAGVTPPKAMRGTSLLRDIPARTAYAESFFPRIHLGWRELRSAIEPRFQLIDGGRPELYDYAADPAERRNVAADERREYAALRDRLAGFGSAFSAPDAVDAEEMKKLASLGYVSAGAETSGELPIAADRIADLARLKEIAELQQRGDRAGAIARMESLLAANPRWSDVRDQLGEAYENAGDAAKAAATFEDGIRLTPRLAPHFARSAAEALLEEGKVAEAEAHATVAADGGAPGAHLLLGEIALARGDVAAAEREAATASNDATDRALALFLRGRIAGARHDYAGALEWLDRSNAERQRTHGSLPRRFHYVAADALAHLGRLDDAQREFEAEIAADPHDVQAYGDLALVRLMSGRRDLSAQTLERMVAANPNRATYLFAASSTEHWGDAKGAAAWRGRAARVQH